MLKIQLICGISPGLAPGLGGVLLSRSYFLDAN